MMVAESLPDGMTERLACNVLNICRNAARSAPQQVSFIGPRELPSRCRKNARRHKALDATEQQQGVSQPASTRSISVLDEHHASLAT